jgi:uncharacterized membrane protein
MQIDNPLQMNDWEIRKFLKAVLAIQLIMWGVIGLDTIDLQIPILRQLIGFVYLTFVPGIIILRILKLHKLGNIETLLYTVGLSLATLMFTGLFMNTVYPYFGISGPISITPLIITISAVVLVLCVLGYVRDKDFSNPTYIDIKSALSPPALFLCVIPFLSIFGTYLVNFYHSNILLMFLIIILALIVVLIAFDKFIPKDLYPLAVFIISISLLYHGSLISMYLVEWADDVFEYWFSKTVVINLIWDSTISGHYNAMLSLVMLSPIYSIISNMEITWVFKIIYPLLFSLVPLGLYRVFQKQTDDKIGFLSVFFFMSMFSFFVDMVGLNRQKIAELFLVLLIMLMINKNMDKIERSFLFIVFGMSLAVSHYTLSYFYMFSLISAWLILVLMDSIAIQKLRDNFHSKFSRKREEPGGNQNSLKIKDRTISSTFVLLFIVFTFTWYIYVSQSAFNAIIYIGDHIASTIFTEFLNPEAAQGLNIILMEHKTLLGYFNKTIHLTTQFFIIIGILVSLLKPKERDINASYLAFSIPFFGICLSGILIPHFAESVNTSRLYHVSLVFLAPFCVIGGMMVSWVLSRIVRASFTNKNMRGSLKVLSIFFVIYLFFNSGFIFELANQPSSFQLNSTAFNRPHFNEEEVDAARWLSDNIDSSKRLYADGYNAFLLQMSLGSFSPLQGNKEVITPILNDTYIFLGRENVMDGKIRLDDPEKPRLNCTLVPLQNLTFYNTLLNMSEIYNNGCAQIYYRGF